MNNQGWECPKCKFVYAPTWSYCTNCNREIDTAAGVANPITLKMEYCKCWPPRKGMLTNGNCADCNKPIMGGGLLR